jgi:hypothetical protein
VSDESRNVSDMNDLDMVDVAYSVDLPVVVLGQSLRPSGLLWLINRMVFHPRGFMLGEVTLEDGGVAFTLQGDGSEPFYFPPELEDELFVLAQTTLAARYPATED